MRSITVSLNGVYQQLNDDFVTKGHTIVFKQAPTGTLDLRTHSRNNHNMSSYPCNGTQTTFHLPAFPTSKFSVVVDHTESVPKGYSVVDVHYEIESWIRDNCPPSDWKWSDQLTDPRVAGRFGMIRMIVKDSVLTYIATRWSE